MPPSFRMTTVSYSTTLPYRHVPSMRDGSFPIGGVVLDSENNMYGTTSEGEGGSGGCPSVYDGCGLVFELSGELTVLYDFCSVEGCADGYTPDSGLIFDSRGNLYGTTSGGNGNVFELSPPGPASNAWTETVLHAFTGGADGDSPSGGLIFDSQGNLYGTTTQGGAKGGGHG
jgi:hypothetical protein